MSRLAIRLLGSYGVTLDGLPLTTFATDKVRALLAYLAVESGQPQRRDALAALLWPNHHESAAHTNLRQALYRLRCTIGDRQASRPQLLITAKEVQLDPAGDHWLDMAEFEAHSAAFWAHHPRGLNLCPDCVVRLEAAVHLYRGDFLAGFTLPSCSRFEWWKLSTQETCHRQALQALHQLILHCEAQRDHASVLQYSWRQIELEPWHEPAHRHRMRALALSGLHGEALHQYEICCRNLAQEMGVEPSAETTQLYEWIREGVVEMRMHETAAMTIP
jgi:DNA-binding SARP family transcriptional activator